MSHTQRPSTSSDRREPAPDDASTEDATVEAPEDAPAESTGPTPLQLQIAAAESEGMVTERAKVSDHPRRGSPRPHAG